MVQKYPRPLGLGSLYFRLMTTTKVKIWEILYKHFPKDNDQILNALLKNRSIINKKQSKEFFEPTPPAKISLKRLGIEKKEVVKALARIKQAKINKEHVVVYGDYDADGITGTATMWETLHSLGIHVLPHIPERFTEGYGLNLDSVKKLKNEDPDLKLIVTVDHGITAGKKVEELKKIGIDMIITDHHSAPSKKPKPIALIYTTQIGGSAVSWILAREIYSSFKMQESEINEKLQLAAIGTIADQLPLLGPNRSIVKHGLVELNKTKRFGVLEMLKESKVEKGAIGVYEVGFIIAPRINSTGRLDHAIESLRLLCTKSRKNALEIAEKISKTNTKRQKIVETVVEHARLSYSEKGDLVIIMSHETYHEGVIGLAAARLTEEYYRPSIVLSTKGDIAKASARSISGFNIIQAIRSLEDLYIDGGGHTMAAGFSIPVKNIGEFTKKINSYAKNILTPEILTRKLKIDLELGFDKLGWNLLKILKDFEPTGIGNQSPTFLSKAVEVVDAKKIGKESNHLKLKLRQNGKIFDSIYFGGAEFYSDITPDTLVDVVYRLEENVWNGHSNLQLFVKDMRFS